MSAAYYPTGGTSTSSQIASTWITTTSSATSSSTTLWVYPNGGTVTTSQYVPADPQTYTIPKPLKDLLPGYEYDLPDGSKLKIDHQGNYTIEDTNAQVTYRANRIREFNPYLNASDLLEDFIRDMGKEGVLQSELLSLPVNVFIHWLILQAALKDGDPVDDVVPPAKVLPPPKVRCLCCGRFLPRVKLAANLLFCDGVHFDRYLMRSAMLRGSG